MIRKKTEENRLSSEEQAFLSLQENLLAEFVNSEKEILHLEPMNAYYRRLIHQLSIEFKLESFSEGEDKNRHIVLKKNPDSTIPEQKYNEQNTCWDFGDREFFVGKDSSGIKIVLTSDGNVEEYMSQDSIKIIARKTVTTGSFKIKQNQIIVITDEIWAS